MRKVKLVSILVILVFIISGCSGGNTDNSMPFKREHDAKNDVIKFYDFEWFTEASDIIEKFNKDFGKDSYDLEIRIDNQNNNYDLYVYEFMGKNHNDLLWKIAGHELKRLYIQCLSADNGKHCYLINGSYYFKDNNKEVYDDIAGKLNDLYSKYKKDNFFIDDNGNFVNYIENTSMNKCTYICRDGADIQMENYKPAETDNITNNKDTKGL